MAGCPKPSVNFGANRPWKGGLLAVLFGITAYFLPAQSYLGSIRSTANYASLQGPPAIRKYGREESVKVVWQCKEDRLYFLDGEDWEWHYDFCHAELGFWQQRYIFNQQCYSADSQREFVLGNVNHYPEASAWTLEFSPSDQIPPVLIEAFFERVRDSLFAGPSLALFLNTERLESLYQNQVAPFPVLGPDELYAGQRYQPLVKGEACGYLRKMSLEDLASKYPGPRDIVVVDGTPLDMPATAGLVSSQFQTPLSHLNILCQNRKTPFFAHRDIWTLPLVDSLEWELVCMEVGEDTFSLRKGSLDEAERHWLARMPAKRISPEKNLERKSLVPVEKLHHKMVGEVGGKAANFGTLARIGKRKKDGFLVPENAFAIPFYWYAEHMGRSGADSLLQKLLADRTARSNPAVLEQRLELIQERIKSSPIHPDLLAEIAVMAGPGQHRLRFRSSTNAEDVDGFNGAGLYSSKTAWLGAPEEKRQVDGAIRKVWASLWNYRAFQEREYFGISQQDVAMGILVHRSFPEEHANGVAITKNLYRKSYYGFVINVQIGETSVVSPPAGVACDQLICYSEAELAFFKERDIIEYISHSSLLEEGTVLSRAQIVFLTKELARIKEYYYWNVGGYSRKYDYKDFALDIEFKFDGPENRLYIKQVRIYND